MAPNVVAALFVERGGAYFGLVGVDPWDLVRDARRYAGPHPVIAHPPCERWGRYWYGGPVCHKNGRRKEKGDDSGCFEAALAAVRTWGGVLEHPRDSAAWSAFGLLAPPRDGGWIAAGDALGWTCCVSQGHYGHRGDKPTWLYAAGMVALPSLRWGKSDKRAHIGGMSRARAATRQTVPVEMLSRGQRAATPQGFRDVLLALARTASRPRPAGPCLFPSAIANERRGGPHAD